MGGAGQQTIVCFCMLACMHLCLPQVNLVSMFRCSSPPRNPVYARRVDPSALALSLSSHTPQSFLKAAFALSSLSSFFFFPPSPKKKQSFDRWGTYHTSRTNRPTINGVPILLREHIDQPSV
jgi:hypothetical protein